MSEDQPNTRKIVQEIEISSSPEAVWKALTDPEEITRWFCDEARVTPGPGGNYWVSFGEGQAADSLIEAWEPNSRLAIKNLPYQAADAQYDEQAAAKSPMMQEFTIDSRGGRTMLRVVDSGIPSILEWDGLYDGKSRGWKMFFEGLRHYLEKHPGKPRRNIVDFRPINIPMSEVWEKLTGSEGLAASGSLADVPEGKRYSVTTSEGEDLRGEVLFNLPPKSLTITIENLDDALLSMTLEEISGTTYFYLNLATFGIEPHALEELRERWTGLLQRILPVADPGSAPSQ